MLDRYQRKEISLEEMSRLLDESTYHVFYRSQATYFPDEAQLQALLEWSRTYNAEHDITGLLLYSDGRFTQLIEGAEAVIHPLFDRIRQDTRHQHVVTISDGPAPHRWFVDWSMAFGELAPVELTQLVGAVEAGRPPLLPLADPHLQTLLEAFSLVAP